jgi:hypothetical protein
MLSIQENEKAIKLMNDEVHFEIDMKIVKLKEDINVLLQERTQIESGDEQMQYLLDSSQLVSKFIELDTKEIQLLNSNQSSEALNIIMQEKQNVVHEYLTLFDSSYTYTSNTMKTYDPNLCKKCNISMDHSRSGYWVCLECGLCEYTIDATADLSYKELQDYNIRPQFTYEKQSHLEEWIRRFQSKEKVIPQEVLDKVILEASKERIKDLNLLTEDKVKRYLKRLELNEYYDNVIGIINRINGRPPFKLSSEIEEKIKLMFQQIQDPFERHKPKTRKNFLSYSYTLHKFFQILGLHEFARYFPLLKSDDKLRQQDDIFKKIVAEMAERDKTIDWKFYPSI